MNNQISTEKWEYLLECSSYSSPFQSPAFYKLFNSIPGFSAIAVGIEDNVELKALCVITIQKEDGIKSYFSRRAIIYGGPILLDNDPVYLKYLLDKIYLELNKRVIYIEIRNLNDYKTFKMVFDNCQWIYSPFQNFLIDCIDKETVYKNLNDNRKRQIKKAIKKGVYVKEAENIDEVKDFYSILLNLYSRKIKKPLLPWPFFSEFYEKNVGKYLLVYYNGSIIGGMLCPIFQNRCIYEFYICGLDNEYRELHPSVMATWGALEYAILNRIKKFDFMGAGSPDKNYGVREFKARFGGELVEYGRYIIVYNRFLYTLGKFALDITRILRK